jgi:dTMP kinase
MPLTLIMPNAKHFKADRKMKQKGFFICIEGLDGCGKTTQTKLLVSRLKKKGYDAISTAEPSQGKIGRFIRKHYLNCEKRVSSIVEALLFAADRFEHVEYEIIPGLDGGRIVVSDRYVYSSLAYQGAMGIDLEWIRRINEHAIIPDMAVFIDVAPETVIKRLKPKRSVMENLENQRKVREVYLEFVRSKELTSVDGNKSKKEVADTILKAVLGLLKKPS